MNESNTEPGTVNNTRFNRTQLLPQQQSISKKKTLSKDKFKHANISLHEQSGDGITEGEKNVSDN